MSNEPEGDGLEQQDNQAPTPMRAFAGIADPLIAQIYQGSVLPKTLFHYTSSAGLIGIVAKHKLWFSDAMFLNDGSEASYGVRVFGFAIDEFMSGKPEEELLAAERLKANIAEAMRHFQAIIFCMSARNNLLNQWRDYGRDVVPYCLEFDREKIEDWKGNEYTFPVFITKIVYRADVQRELMLALIEKVYSITKTILGGRRSFDDNEGEMLLAGAAIEICKLIIRFKNPAFEAEEEWRLISYRDDAEKLVKREYRASSLGAVPYYEWYRTGETKHLPIESVTVGPSPYAQVSDLALKLLLSDHGYDVETHYSTIPIRR